MRIVVANPFQDRRGGVETYVERLLALLLDAGHDVTAVFDRAPQPGRPRLAVPPRVQSHTVEKDGLESTIRAINSIDNAVVLANSIDSNLFDAEWRIERPVAYYAHTYVASCINGLRINRRPEMRPCNQVFGPACLIRYFPRRCGGRSPITMLTAYRQETGMRDRLAGAALVIANSAAVARQLAAGGIAAETLYPFVGVNRGVPRDGYRNGTSRSLLFVGRFEDYKGGEQLLTALPQVSRALDIPIRLKMAGEGSKSSAWKRRAAAIAAQDSRITIEFPGWLSDDDVEAAYAESDLLVIPSVWPEPFGLVGLEAAGFGLPAAAFAVGGIPEWLIDGESGHLADGLQCSPLALADAITRCLANIEHLKDLSSGAVRNRSRFSVHCYVERLTELLGRIEKR